FFFSSRRRHTRFSRDWSSDVCSSDLGLERRGPVVPAHPLGQPAAVLHVVDPAQREGHEEHHRGDREQRRHGEHGAGGGGPHASPRVWRVTNPAAPSTTPTSNPRTIVSAAAVPTSKLPRNAVRNTSKLATIVETPGPPAVTTATRSNTLNAITSCSTAAASTVGATTGATTERSVRHQPAPSSAAASHSSAGTPSRAA